MSYDPAILQVSDVTDGEFADNAVLMEGNWDDAGGVLTIVVDLSGYAAGGNGISGNGYFCDIHFQTIGSGTTMLAIDGMLEQMRNEEISEISGMQWINSNVNVIQWYNLITGSSGSGEVTNPGEGAFEYPEGQQVTITAASTDACWEFANWTGDTGTIASPNSASTTITMNGDYEITANFAINTFTLTYNAGTGGSITGATPQTVECGSDGFQVTAVPGACYNFTGWSDGVLTASRTDTNVTEDITVTANFAIKQFTLTTSSEEGGSVTDPGEGTFSPYNCGTNASIVATPDQCRVFVAWTGTGVTAGKVANPNSSSTTITMDDNYSVHATFAVSDTFELTLQADPSAGGAPSYDGSSPFDCGDIVNIYANPDPCYDFVEWTGPAVVAGKVADPEAENTTVIMHSNYTLTANYTIKQFSLTYNAGIGGSITGTSPQTVNCGSNGSQVTAVPAACYNFTGWSDGVLTASRTDTNVTENLTVTANFVIKQFTLTYIAGTGGTIEGTTSQTVNCGSDGSQVTATPNACYHFVNWSDGVLTAARTDTNVTEDITVTANFAINTFTLTYNAGTGGSITGITPQTVNCGSDGSEVTAVPSACYNFTGWSDSVLTASRTDTNVQANINVTANFAIKQFTLTTSSGEGGSVTDPGEGTFSPYNCGTNASIVATPDQCRVFVAWTGTGVTAGKVANPNSSSTTITMDDNYSVHATFAVSDTFELTLQADPSAGGAPSYDGSSPFDCGDIVNIYANPDPCYDFVEWTGPAVDAGKVADPSSADTTVTMHSNYTLTANYAIKQFTLTTSVSPVEAADAGATVSGAGIYNCSESAQIEANPAGPHSFAYWTSSNPAINGSTNISENVLMDGDYEITANFVIHPNTVYFEDVAAQEVDVQFTVDIIITDTVYLTYAYFDLGFNSSVLRLDGILAVNWGNQFHPTTVSTDTIGDGLVRVIWDNSAWANNVNGGYGASGSGILCTAYFTPLVAGTSPLSFVPGANTPRLLKWENYVSSEITPSYWNNGSVTVE